MKSRDRFRTKFGVVSVPEEARGEHRETDRPIHRMPWHTKWPGSSYRVIYTPEDGEFFLFSSSYRAAR